jgi:hypothetical protein
LETRTLARQSSPTEVLRPRLLTDKTMPDGELTLEEKKALLKHWLDRGKPTVILGQARWFNLEVLLYSTDTYVAQRRREHTSELRQLLARWNNNQAEVPNENTEVRPGERQI